MANELKILGARGFLAALDGSCRTPIAGIADTDGTTLKFRGEVLTVDGQTSWRTESERTLAGVAESDRHAAAFDLGEQAAHDIRGRAGFKIPHV